MTQSELENIINNLSDLTQEERQQLLEVLRSELPIHTLEKDWNIRAEVILEAISRSSSLTQRGVRGVIAEAVFVQSLVPTFKGWKDITKPGDIPYDCELTDGLKTVRIQVKLQRSEKGIPKKAKNKWGAAHTELFVVETQKTRSGKSSDGSKTRPYRYADFDILAVCLYPSTQDWARFVFTVSSWLLPDPSDPKCLAVFQPVSPERTSTWTSDFAECIEWFQSGEHRKVITIEQPPKVFCL